MKLYTADIYQRFEVEFKKAVSSGAYKKEDTSDGSIWNVISHDDRQRSGIVEFCNKPDGLKIKCSCMLFEECG